MKCIKTSLENLYVNIEDWSIAFPPEQNAGTTGAHSNIFVKYENTSYNKVFFLQVWIHVPMKSPEDECERHLFVDQVT